VTKIFSEAAARAPCCILIDNIDLLCYSRTAPGASELQKRIVSCLLTLMDGVSTGAEALPGVASQGNDPGCVLAAVWLQQVLLRCESLPEGVTLATIFCAGLCA
jgi:SpoVK/Ycf46/Vps4 family AAA+-type ATPase